MAKFLFECAGNVCVVYIPTEFSGSSNSFCTGTVIERGTISFSGPGHTTSPCVGEEKRK